MAGEWARVKGTVAGLWPVFLATFAAGFATAFGPPRAAPPRAGAPPLGPFRATEGMAPGPAYLLQHSAPNAVNGVHTDYIISSAP